MAPAIIPVPARGMKAGFRRFSVSEYHKLIDMGFLTENDELELLEGMLVNKMSRNPSHDGTIQLIQRALLRVAPVSLCLRVQCAITLADSEPEPDLVLARGDERTFLARHPGPMDLALVVEVANTTLDDDREDKGRIYARAKIGYYWIANLVDMQIEVYTNPSGPTTAPAYATRQDFRIGDMIPLVIDNNVVANIEVRDLLP